MTGLRRREELAHTQQDEHQRAERAAEAMRERAGLSVRPQHLMGGLWVSLEDVETWLGISPPTTPPLPPPRRRPPHWHDDEGACDCDEGET